MIRNDVWVAGTLPKRRTMGSHPAHPFEVRAPTLELSSVCIPTCFSSDRNQSARDFTQRQRRRVFTYTRSGRHRRSRSAIRRGAEDAGSGFCNGSEGQGNCSAAADHDHLSRRQDGDALLGRYLELLSQTAGRDNAYFARINRRHQQRWLSDFSSPTAPAAASARRVRRPRAGISAPARASSTTMSATTTAQASISCLPIPRAVQLRSPTWVGNVWQLTGTSTGPHRDPPSGRLDRIRRRSPMDGSGGTVSSVTRDGVSTSYSAQRLTARQRR